MTNEPQTNALIIQDLNKHEEIAYEQFTDELTQEFDELNDGINRAKIGQLLINSDPADEQPALPVNKEPQVNGLTTSDVNTDEEELFERFSDELAEDYNWSDLSWSKVGQLLINTCEL